MNNSCVYFGIRFLILTMVLFVNGTYGDEKKRSIHPASLKINLLEGDPPTFHPHFALDLRDRSLGKALFEGLVRINENDAIEMAAAEKVDISENVYTFTLRPHLWSNGEPVTAHHFEAAWKLALSPNSRCRRPDLFYIIKNAREAHQGTIPMDQLGVKAIDSHTLAVELAYPAPYFLNLLSNSIFSPLFDDAKEPQVFNGPFALESWKHNVSIKLARNPFYWDAGKVHLQEIVFSMVKDPSTVLTLFEKGELDYIGNPLSSLPLDALSSDTYADHLNYKEISRTYWINVNVEKPPMNSAKIRKAFSRVLDRKNLTTHLLIGESPHKSPVPKNLSLLKEEEMYQDADLAGGIKLFEEGLKELGLTRETCPPLILSHNHLPGQKSLAEALQQIWQTAFGIPIKLEGYEWNTFIARIDEGQFHLGGCLYGSWYSDPLHHLEMFKDKDYFINASGWEHDTYKQLLNLSVTTDENERKKQLKKAELFLLEEMPVIPIFVGVNKYMMNDRLNGLVVDKSGCLDLKKACFKGSRIIRTAVDRLDKAY